MPDDHVSVRAPKDWLLGAFFWWYGRCERRVPESLTPKLVALTALLAELRCLSSWDVSDPELWRLVEILHDAGCLKATADGYLCCPPPCTERFAAMPVAGSA